jgi:hypothetical protein
MSLSSSQSSTNCKRWSKENVLSKSIFPTHSLFFRACETVQFFLLEEANISRAISIGFLPLSHGASQKGVLQPSPRIIEVEA